MGASAFVGIGGPVAASYPASSLTINKPTGVADGHALLAVVTRDDNAGNPVTPTGWTRDRVDNNPNSTTSAQYSRVASSEPSSTTWTSGSPGNDNMWGLQYAASGVNTTTSRGIDNSSFVASSAHSNNSTSFTWSTNSATFVSTTGVRAVVAVCDAYPDSLSTVAWSSLTANLVQQGTNGWVSYPFTNGIVAGWIADESYSGASPYAAKSITRNGANTQQVTYVVLLTENQGFIPDEDFWQNRVAPTPATMYQQLPLLWGGGEANTAIKFTVTKTPSLDAVIQTTITETSSLDAVVQITSDLTPSLDAVIQTDFTHTPSLDAVIQTDIAETTSLDAVIQSSPELTASLDSVIETTFTKTPVIDAVIETTITETPLLDAAIAVTNTLTPSVDAAIAITGSHTPSLDAVIQAIRTLTPNINAAIALTRNIPTDLDAAVSLANSITTRLSAYISKEEIESNTTARTIISLIIPPDLAISKICQRRRYLDIDKNLQQLTFMTEAVLNDLERLDLLPEPYARLYRKYINSESPKHRVSAISALLVFAVRVFYTPPEYIDITL